MSAADAGDGAISSPPGTAGPAGAGPDRRKWMILGVIAVAQLMVVLDGTVVNIALPDAQRALGFGNADRQWIITGYALAFGSLLLLGGKLADLLGRKTTFLAGLIGFAVASAVGGASTGFEMLVTARVCQGAFGALLAPAGLSLLTTTFPGRKERGTAFAVYGAIVASGSALGMLLGGVLTEYLDWRWCLYINLVFAAVGVVGGIRMLEQSRPAIRPKLDLPGTVSICGALFCLVYGFSNAESHAWSAPSTWGFLAAGVVLLAAFAAWQARAANPLLPLRILADRNRAGAYTATFLIMTGISGVFLFLTYYLQETRGYSPVATGLAYIPMLTAAVVMGMLSNLRLLPRTGPKPLIIIGLLLAACGMAWMTRIGLDTGYLTSLLGPLVVTGAGMGLALSPSQNTATYRVPASDAGVASAMVNTMQQVGQSVGTALLNTIAISATTSYLTGHAAGTAPSAALQGLSVLHGYTTAFWWAAGILAAACLICSVLLRRGVLAGQGDSGGHGDTPAPRPEPEPAVIRAEG
jgi:EmrB/QacA subfamily drug resistance transporter